MSKADPRDSRKPDEPQKQPVSAPVFRPPLRPRRRLFYGLLGVLALWIVALLILYFKTVYPTRDQQPAPVREPVGKTVPR